MKKDTRELKTDSRVPPNLVLTASLSCALSIVVSVVSIVLCTIALYFRGDCDSGMTNSSPGSSYFTAIIHHLYFKKEDCDTSISLDDITKEETVFLFAIIYLVVSILCLIAAIAFLTVIKLENATKYIEATGYVFISVCFVMLIVEIVTAVHFGMDYSTFGDMMNNSSPGVPVNYSRDMGRLGAFFLMVISLKGFLAPVMTLIFNILIIVYLVEFRKTSHTNAHSIHKTGALNAFDQPRRFEEQQSENSFQQFRAQPKRVDDSWQQPSSENMYPHYKGPQINAAYVNDDDSPSPRIHNRDNSRADYSNPAFDRSYSWQNSQPSVASRPFSYLEEPKPRVAPKPASPMNDRQWGRDWQNPVPAVPAPDYSPDSPRRLKSALKSSYM